MYQSLALGGAEQHATTKGSLHCCVYIKGQNESKTLARGCVQRSIYVNYLVAIIEEYRN